MKTVRLLHLVFFLTLSCKIFSQTSVDTLVVYGQGKSCSLRITDSALNVILEIDYYPNGSSQLIERFSFPQAHYIDSSVAFHENGNIAWVRHFNNISHALEGPFYAFYLDGSIKTSGSYFNGFKTGVWKEYYEFGTVKTETKFELSKEDSTFDYSMNSDWKTKVSYDTLVWGGPFKFIDQVNNDTIIIEPVICYFSYFQPSNIIYSRSYDQRGRPVIPSRQRKPRKNAP